MTFRHLEIFICVYQHSSITKAAKELHISQPSVSMAIKELEQDYQTQLFERMNRKIYPTEAAKHLFEYACHIQSSLIEMEEKLKTSSISTISIGCSIAISQFILPALLSKFQNLYPNIHFKMKIDNSTTIEKCILQNELDFAFIETDPYSQDIIKIPFFTDYLETIVNPHHPLLKKKNISLQDILMYDYYTREPDSSINILVNSVFTSHQLKLVPSVESINTASIIELVCQTNAISTLPYATIERSLQNKLVQRLNLPELHIQRTYHIIYHKNKYMPELYQELFNVCLSQYR